MNELSLPFETDLVIATVAYDDGEPDAYYIRLDDDVVTWCDQTLTEPVSLFINVSESFPGYCVVFACSNDLLHFKLRWI
jgi:hypothetical protein